MNISQNEKTVFKTGAVRDNKKGVGRMDLLPLTAIIELSIHCQEGAEHYGEHNVDKGIPQHSLCDSAMRHLIKYMRGDTDENHIRAAAWNIMYALEQSVTKPGMNDLIWAKERSGIDGTHEGRATATGAAEKQCSHVSTHSGAAFHN